MCEYFVSVIIPCYNAEPYLPALFQEMRRRKRGDMEFLLINDGSTDRTEALCRQLEQEDERVRVLSQKNAGVSTARNVGVEAARGRYIYFMDCDDSVDWECMDRVLSQVDGKNPDYVVFGYKVRVIRGQKTLKEKSVLPGEVLDARERRISLMKELFGISPEDVAHWQQTGKLNQRKKFSAVWSHLYRRDFLKDNNILFHPQLKLYEDGMFNCECLLLSEQLLFLDETPYTYLQSDRGAVSSFVNPAAVFDNKMTLVDERERMIRLAQEKWGVPISRYSMGSEVLSLFQMAALAEKDNWRQIEGYIRRYASKSKVQEAMRCVPCCGTFKFKLPLFLLKRGCYKTLLLLVLCAKCAGGAIRF